MIEKNVARSALSSDLPIEYFLDSKSANLAEVSALWVAKELLSQNNTLKQLDLSLNHMDYRAALILEDALVA